MTQSSISSPTPAPPLWRLLLAGALAGASVVFVLMLATGLLLASGAFWQFAFNSSIPILQQTAAAVALDDLSRLPAFLWGWRWIMLGLVMGGGALAWADRWVQRLPALWHRGLLAAAVVLLVGSVTITGVLVSSEQVLFSGADQSASLATLEQRRSGVVGPLLIGAAFAVALTGAVWLAWSWWYDRWRRWLRATPAPTAQADGSGGAEAWFERRQAHRRALRVILLGALGALLALVGALLAYEQGRATVQSGDLWVEPSAPTSAVRLTFIHPQRQLLVENSYGSGSVAITLLASPAGTPATGGTVLTLPEKGVSFAHQGLEVAQLPSGQYQLQAQLQSGPGGRVGYALIQRSALLAFAAALLVGLSTSALLAIGALLMSLRGG